MSELIERIRDDVIGGDSAVTTPFGRRRVTYADYTASGRSLYSAVREGFDTIATGVDAFMPPAISEAAMRPASLCPM